MNAVLAIVVLSAAHNLLLLALPIYSLQIMSRVLPSGDASTLCSLTVLLILAIGADWVVERSRAATLTRLASEAILRFQYEVSQRSEHLTDDVYLFELACQLKTRLAGPLGLAVLDAPWASVFLLALFYLKVELGFAALIILAGTFAVGAFSSVTQQSRAKSHQLTQSEPKSAACSGRGNRSFSGLRHGLFLETIMLTLTAADGSYEQSREKSNTSHAVRVVGQAALIAATAMLVAREELAVGSILATSMLFARAIAPIDGCSDVIAIRDCFRMLSELSRRRKVVVAAPVRVKPLLPPVDGGIALVGVGVRHRSALNFILRDVTFEFMPGRLTVIAGSSGSGKSTLLDVMSGSVKPDVGQVRLDGFALADIDIEHRNQIFGRLDVRPMLVQGPLAQIIAGERALLLRSVIEAAELVGLDEHIRSLPDGYRTLLFPDRPSLSRGQLQQLLLARAFYGNPKLLLLDEPAAFLDEQSILKLAAALEAARRGGTNIIVATRCPEIIALHDDIVCLADGKFTGSLSRKEIEGYVRLQEMGEAELPAI